MYFSFFFKQKTAYEMRISDWSSDVCSSDLAPMVLRLKARESRSPPGLPWAEKPKTKPDPGQQNITRTTPFQNAPEPINAGWSSPVARQAHNLKVAGSNPAPATSYSYCNTAISRASDQR